MSFVCAGKKRRKNPHVASYHGDLIEGRKAKLAGDGPAIVVPVTQVISEPLANFLPCADEGRASDDEGPEPRPAFCHTLLAVHAHHEAVEVVSIVLKQAICVLEVCANGMLAEHCTRINRGGDWREEGDAQSRESWMA